MVEDVGAKTSRTRHFGTMDKVDVLVIGGGNAALCAALTAWEAGQRIAAMRAEKAV